MEAFSEAKSAIPEDRWLDVTYEGFVENPPHELRRIFDFLGLSCPTDIEERLAAWDVRTTRKAAYRQDLSKNDLNSLRRVLAGELERWGYA
jgi:hypothetical protein